MSRNSVDRNLSNLPEQWGKAPPRLLGRFRFGGERYHSPGPRNTVGLVRVVSVLLTWWLLLLVPSCLIAKEAVVMPLAKDSLLLDGTAVGSRVVVVGERGHILISQDDGMTWRQAQVPTRALLTAIHMHDEQTGWAVGHDAIILRTVDGGESWDITHEAPEEELPLLDVWFHDENRGIAIGAYGYFLATEDGGETWNSRFVGDEDLHLNALIPALAGEDGSRRLFIAAETGVVYRSDDIGETWDAVPSPYAGSWFGGLALDGNRLILTGLRGHVFRTEDGGENWTEVATGTQATLTGAIRLPSGKIVMTGLEGSVLTSSDGGLTVQSSNLPTRQGISAALPLGNESVLLIGEFGTRRLQLAD